MDKGLRKFIKCQLSFIADVSISNKEEWEIADTILNEIREHLLAKMPRDEKCQNPTPTGECNCPRCISNQVLTKVKKLISEVMK